MPEQGEFRWKLTADDSEYQQATGRVQEAQKRLLKSTAKLAGANNETFGPKQQKQIDSLTQKLNRQQEAARKASRDVEDIRRQYQSLKNLDTSPKSLRENEAELRRVQNELNRTEKLWSKLENRFQKLDPKARLGTLKPEEEIEYKNLIPEFEAVDSKWSELNNRAKELRDTIGQIKMSPESTIEAQNLASKLQSAEEKANRLAQEASNTATEINKIQEQSEKIDKPTSRASEAMKKFAFFAKNASKEVQGTNRNTNKLSDSVSRLGKRITSLASAALVFNVIRKGLRSLSSYLSSVLKTNQQFVDSLATVKGNLLTAFQPIYEAILPALNALMSVLAKVTGYLAAFTNLLFGKSISASQKSAKNLYNQANALDSVATASKNASKSLAQFDTISQLSSDSSGGGSGGGGSSAVQPIFEEFEFDDRILSFFDEVKDALSEVGGALSDVAKTFKKVWENGTGKKTIGNIKRALSGVVGWVKDIAIAWRGAWEVKGEALVQSLLDRFNALLNLINRISQSFRKAWNDSSGQAILENIFQIFTNINKAVIGIYDGIRNAWETAGLGDSIASGILDIINAILGTVQEITGAIAEWASNVDFVPFLSAVNNLVQKILPFIQKIKDLLLVIWDMILKPLFDFLIQTAFPILIEVIGSVVDVLSGVIDFLVGVFTGDWERAWEGIKNILSGVWEAIVNVFKLAWETIFGVLKGAVEWIYNSVIKPIGDFFTNLWNGVKDVAVLAWTGIKNTWNSVANWFNDTIVKPIANFFGSLWEGIKTGASVLADFMKKYVIDPIVNLFKGFYNTVVGIIEAVVNGFIGIINGFINGINLVIKTINLIPGVNLGQIATLPKANIPRLATGTVVPPNSEFLAMLGDNKKEPEIVSPLSTMKQALAEAMAEYGGAAGGEIVANITLNLDGEAIYNSQQRIAQRRGQNLLNGRVPV